MATQAEFFTIPKFGRALASAANANRDGTGSLTGAILTGAANGTKIERLRYKARDTTTLGMVRFFVFDGSATYTLLEELNVPALTPSATVKSAEDDIDYSVPEKYTVIPSGYQLLASTHNAEAIFVMAWGNDR